MLTETVRVQWIPCQVEGFHKRHVTAVQRPIWSQRRWYSRGDLNNSRNDAACLVELLVIERDILHILDDFLSGLVH